MALVAGNFPAEGRPRAYGLVGAAGAIAIAVGPLIGGLATTYASWRLVFAGEVLLGAVILPVRPPHRRRTGRGAPASRPARFAALGVGPGTRGHRRAAVLGVGLAAACGRARPRCSACRRCSGSFSAGCCRSGCSCCHIRRLEAAGGEPLVSPSLFGNRQMTGGLVMFFFQYMVMMGMFFVIPLYLSVALGLSAIETGIKITPLSITMLLAAAGIPRFFPAASPRRVVEGSLLAVIVGIVVLVSSMDVACERRDRDRSAAADRAGHGRPRLAARERHRVGGPR